MPLHIGNIFMVVAPSGAGKSSLVNALLEQDHDVSLSISCTTRAARDGEQDGKEYNFVSTQEFLALRDSNGLLEWAEVHGNYYGTPRNGIEACIEQGRDILLEIDWQGARQVRSHFPDAIGIFILPPSIEALETRLRKRGKDSQQTISKRLLAAGSEMSHVSECQYVIINQEFSLALKQLAQIICAARLRYVTQAARNAPLFSQLGISKTPV